MPWYTSSMTPTFSSLAALSDRDVLAQLDGAIGQERHATAHVIALLMEVDARKLFAAQSCSSLFTFCVQVLHFSEHAAYLRIEAARAARRFPAVLERLADGSLHLTAVSLLAPHLTLANHVEVLDAARHKSKREVEHLLARLRPQPDVPAIVRKLPTPTTAASQAPRTAAEQQPPALESITTPILASPSDASQARIRPAIKPIAPERFKVQFTVSRDTYEKLRQVQGLLRHTIPDGDPALIFDRSLTLLLAELSKSKLAAAKRPRPHRTAAQSGSRHIPAAIKREVWHRDGGQCAFRGEQGRCSETGFLEFHHVLPFARGGATTRENLELRCRAHNVYEAEQQFGRAQPWLVRESRASYGTSSQLGPDRELQDFVSNFGNRSTLPFSAHIMPAFPDKS